ncbi:MAG: FGGY-family carbohydrate kinase, partial [Sphaerochaeta sp.]
ETLSFRLLQLVETLTPLHDKLHILATGGGNKSRELLQIKADMLNCTMCVGQEKELGTYGAAMVAACGLSWFPSMKAAQNTWVNVLERFVPNEANHQAYQEWLEAKNNL